MTVGRGVAWPASLTGALSLVAPVVLLVLVWLPEVRHFYMPVTDVAPDAIDAMRQAPTDALLDELASLRFSNPESRGTDYLVAAARRVLAGELKLSGHDAVPVSMPFVPRDLDRGAPAVQLNVASLTAPNLLMAAFEATGDDAFFHGARTLVVSWCAYANAAVRPRGFLWNDHAIAARLQVMLRFWRLYRSRDDYDPAAGAALTAAVARDMGMLAKPGHFTAGTNHGVMQNLALMQSALAWPALARSQAHADLAVERLSDQLPVFVHPDGIVTEHSPGYHEFGLELLSIAMRLMTLSNREIPAEWQDRFQRAQTVYRMLRRPDGTLPMIGDTDHYADAHLRMAGLDAGTALPLRQVSDWPRRASLWFAPASGYLASWRGTPGATDPSASQLVVSWADLPGAAHKHADETGLTYWSGGTTWWTHVGYWPYGDRFRRDAVGWAGSNAAHPAGVHRRNPRNTELVGQVVGSGVVFLDLSRVHEDGYTVRRQILEGENGLVAVFDSVTQAAGRVSRAYWTAGPGVRLASDADGLRLEDAVSARPMALAVAGSPGLEQTRYSGSRAPFAGWLVVDKDIRRADSLALALPGDGWMGMAWRTARPQAPASRPDLAWTAADDWLVRDGDTTVARSGDTLVMTDAGQTVVVVPIDAPDDIAAVRADVGDRYGVLVDKYRKFRSLVSYRYQVSLAVAACIGVHVLALFAVGRWRRRWYVGLLAATQVAWAGVAGWVLGIYLAT